MGDDILTRAEAAERSGAGEKDIEVWTKAKLLKPVGFADEGVPVYAASDLDLLVHIRKLNELGYGLAEIERILHKVGIPREKIKSKKEAASAEFLTVGQLAERTDLSPRTIKHWEEMGILEPDMRSGGGFRLYSDGYVMVCGLVRDLQLFGYTLEEIKEGAGHFREFLALQKNLAVFPRAEAADKLQTMIRVVDGVRAKMAQLKEGVERWDNLLKKKKKEIAGLQERLAKLGDKAKEKKRA